MTQFPVGSADGRAVSCVIFRDISTRRRAEEQLRAAERKYRSIFENAVEGIFQTTPQGRYLEVNRTLARIYGFETVAEMVEHFRDIKNQLYVDPTRRDDFVRELAARDQVHNFESQIRKKDGSIIWISENARVVRDARGAVEYYEGTVVDITARKRAEAELATQRAYFSQLFANSPQAISLIDMHRNIVDANQGFEELFGYRVEDLKGFGMRSSDRCATLPLFQTAVRLHGPGTSLSKPPAFFVRSLRDSIARLRQGNAIWPRRPVRCRRRRLAWRRRC